MIFRSATETRIRPDKKNTGKKERDLKKLWNEAFFNVPVDYEMNKKKRKKHSSLFQLLSHEERPQEQYYFSVIMSKGWTIIFVKERLLRQKGIQISKAFILIILLKMIVGPCLQIRG